MDSRPGDDNYPISFGDAYVQSKVSVTNENIATEGNAFSVYGFYTTETNGYNAAPSQFTPFNPNPLTVSYSNSPAGWTYENTQYWITGGAYSFMAYFPADFPAQITKEYPATSFKGFEIISQQSQQIDILASGILRKTEEIYDANGNVTKDEVGFQFRHLLSNICIELAMQEGYKATIKAVALTGLSKKADCVYNLHSANNDPLILWSNHSGETAIGENKEVILINKPDDPDLNDDVSEYIDTPDYFGDGEELEGVLVIPQDISDSGIELYIVADITILNQNNTTISNKVFEKLLPVSGDGVPSEWLPGKRYIYSAELSIENNIEFGNPEVEEWISGSMGGTIVIM